MESDIKNAYPRNGNINVNYKATIYYGKRSYKYVSGPQLKRSRINVLDLQNNK